MIRTDVADRLHNEGYDVIRASEYNQDRADDKEILDKAINEKRILITLDEHFGNWAVLPLEYHFGVIRLKVNPTTSLNIIGLLLPFLKLHNYDQFANTLLILSEKKEKWIKTV